MINSDFREMNVLRAKTVFAVALLGASAEAATKITSHAAVQKTGVKKTAGKPHQIAAKPTPAAAKRVRGKNGRLVAARSKGPSYQVRPDTDRYREIQQALASKGYYKGEPTGEWGADSVEALKSFQADQKLPNDGKINSLSLIGLGLGPKHDGSSTTESVAVPPPPEPSAPPQP